MALTLLRHTTPQVPPGTCYGRTDLDLSERFEAEAQAVLTQLPRFTAIVSSPLTRCRRLAAYIAAQGQHEVVTSRHWQEMDFGGWEGQAWDDIPRAEIDGWAADFHGFDGHGGESVATLAARVALGLQEAPDGALIVTHMGCIKAAMAQRGRAPGWQAKLGFGETVTL